MGILKKLLTFAMLSITLTGCQTLAEKSVIPRVDNATYVNKFTPEERAQYDEKVAHTAALLLRKQRVEFNAGLPVTFGEGATAGTLLCNRINDQVDVYKGHITGAMGMEMAALASFKTVPGTCDIEYQVVNGVRKPTLIINQAFSQEAAGRLVLKTAGQVLTGMFNGAVAAQIRAVHDCGDNCGNITMVNTGGNAAAASRSDSGSKTDVNVDIGQPYCKTCF